MMVRRESNYLSTSERRAYARNLGGNAEIKSVPLQGRIFYFQPKLLFFLYFFLEVSLWNMQQTLISHA